MSEDIIDLIIDFDGVEEAIIKVEPKITKNQRDMAVISLIIEKYRNDKE